MVVALAFKAAAAHITAVIVLAVLLASVTAVSETEETNVTEPAMVAIATAVAFKLVSSG